MNHDSFFRRSCRWNDIIKYNIFEQFQISLQSFTRISMLENSKIRKVKNKKSCISFGEDDSFRLFEAQMREAKINGLSSWIKRQPPKEVTRMEALHFDPLRSKERTGWNAKFCHIQSHALDLSLFLLANNSKYLNIGGGEMRAFRICA